MLDLVKKKFKGISKFQSLLFSLALLTILVFTSCEQKKPEEVSITKDTLQVKVEEPAPVDTLVKDTTTLAKEPADGYS